MKYILILLLVVPGISQAQFTTGASESNKEGFLTLGYTTHKNPKNPGILRGYGYGLGQLELGRTWNVRAQNSGGYKLHGLEPNSKEGFSTLIGLEPFNGSFNVGSSRLGNKYHYNPGAAFGIELNGNGYAVVVVGKIGGSVSNLDETNGQAYTPDYTYTRSYSAYLSGPGAISAGYNHLWRRGVVTHSSNVMLLNTVNFTYQDSIKEKLYTVTIDL
jgi:hypothetical protein